MDLREEFAAWPLNVTAYDADGQKEIIVTINNCSKTKELHGMLFRLCF
jgi:hypothetical protein